MRIEDPEETLTITNMTDLPCVQMDCDVGDIMFDRVVDYAKSCMTDTDYFKVGFGMMIESVGDKLIKDSSGQLIFDFDSV